MIKKDSILNQLEDFEIKEVIQDYTLKQKGYEFYFIMDADEIHQYCNPFDLNKDVELDVVSDEQFIIDYLFVHYKQNIIFVNEYIEELDKIRYFLNSTSDKIVMERTMDRYRNELVYWIQQLEENSEDPKYRDKILQAYSFFLAISTGSYDNSKDKFLFIMSMPKSFEGRIKEESINNLLESYTSDRNLLEDIIENHVNDKGSSRLLDVSAFLKTCYLNKKINIVDRNSGNKNSKKKIFYYLSSRTTDIKGLKKKILEKEFNNSLFEIKGVDTIIRTKAQMFAFLVYDLMSDSASEAFDKVLKRFKVKVESNELIFGDNGRERLLTELVNKRERIQQRENIGSLTVHINRRKEIDEKEKEFHFNLDKFKKVIANYHKNKKSQLVLNQELVQVIDRAEEFFNKELDYDVNKNILGNNILEYFNPFIEEIKILEGFSDFVNSHSKEKDKIEFDRGADPIESIFGAFPILYNFPFFEETIFPILCNIKEETLSVKENILDLIEALNRRTRLETIVGLLYLLLIVRYKDKNRDYSSNFIVFSFIYENYIFYKSGNQKDLDLERTKVNLSINILLIGCWAARRSRKYLFAYKLSELGVKLYPDDPRFYYSLALIGYSWKYEFDTSKRYEWDYQLKQNGNKKAFFEKEGDNSVLGYCKLALTKYKHKGNKASRSEYHFYIALLNLTAFVYIIKYKIKLEYCEARKLLVKDQKIYLSNIEFQDYLVQARNLLDKMNDLLDSDTKSSTDGRKLNFPEYLHSEAFLRYYQILNQFHLQGEDYDAKLDCEEAIGIIEMALSYCEKGRPGLRKRCNNLLKRLEDLS